MDAVVKRYVKMWQRLTNGNRSGFALTELLVTLFMVSLVVMIAQPGFFHVLHETKLTATATHLLSDIHLARSEAFKHGTAVKLTARPGGWQYGWTVWVDKDGNRHIDAGEEIRVQDPPSRQIIISSRNKLSEYEFLPDGSTRHAVTDSITFCNGRKGKTGKQLVISGTGRVLILDTSCS